MVKGGKSSGVAAAARGDPKGAKGAKDPVKPKARKPTAAEKDEAKLQELHGSLQDVQEGAADWVQLPTESGVSAFWFNKRTLATSVTKPEVVKEGGAAVVVVFAKGARNAAGRPLCRVRSR